MAPPMSGKRTAPLNREQVSTSASHSEPINANMAPPMSGKRTTRLNPEQVAAPVSQSAPTTTSGRENAREMNEIRKGDDTLAQLNQGLTDLLRAHGSA